MKQQRASAAPLRLAAVVWIGSALGLGALLLLASDDPVSATRPKRVIALACLWLAGGAWTSLGAGAVARWIGAWSWPRSLAAAALAACLWLGIFLGPSMFGGIASPPSVGNPLARRAVSDFALSSAGSSELRPNVLVILADTLRFDHLGFYGYTRETSPRLDELASDSLIFDRALAQAPSTKPSIASLFTSRLPSEHGAIENADALVAEHYTLAEIFAERGYDTGAFVENPVIDAQFGYDQGFARWEIDASRHQIEEIMPDMEAFDSEMRAWLTAPREAPFFGYLHFVDPHSPYRAPKRHRRFLSGEKPRPGGEPLAVGASAGEHVDEQINRYDNEIRYVDHRIGSMLDALREAGQLDHTIVVFLSDHGEGFGEHGWTHHAYGVFGELIRIPLLIRYPAALRPGRSDYPVEHVDIMPTILHLAGIDARQAALRGTAIFDPMVDPEGLAEVAVIEHLVPEWGVRQRSISMDDWKLVKSLDWGIYGLFEMDEDPIDLRNRLAPWDVLAMRLLGLLPADLHPSSSTGAIGTALALAGELETATLALETRSSESVTDLDPETVEALRQLGYLP